MSWWARPSSWPSRLVRWPGRAPPSTTRPPSARWPRRSPAVRTPWPGWPTWIDEGIDQAVLYPTIGLYFSLVEEPAGAVALARAYNDWLATYCAADTRRLFGAALLPLQDPDRGG